MSDLKRAGIISHALHSRLQMVRGKIYVQKSYSITEFIDANREYFEAATVSIKKYHDLAVLETHWRVAAEMFMLTASDVPPGLL